MIKTAPKAHSLLAVLLVAVTAFLLCVGSVSAKSALGPSDFKTDESWGSLPCHLRVLENSDGPEDIVDAQQPRVPQAGEFDFNGPLNKANLGENNKKLNFLFNKDIDPSKPKNVARARGNADRIGIPDTPENRAEVERLFNKALNDSSSIVPGGQNVPGRNLREFFLPGGKTSTGSIIQFVEEKGKVITIFAKQGKR